MAEDDDIDRLLREVEALEGRGGAKPPPAAVGPGKQVAEVTDESGGGLSRGTWALLSAAGGGAVGFIVGSLLFLLPGFDGLSTALGAALGAALAGFVSGPPDRFKK